MLELFIALKWPLIALQALISLVLIIMILLQSGKGDDIGSALGGGSGGNVQGTGGTSKFLVRGTAIFAILFMINSIVLAKMFKEMSAASIGASAPAPLVPSATNSVVGNAVAPNAIAPNAIAPATPKK
ncbi:MAG: Preprotein translocase subunit SecG [Bacteriovoracaceae bacterium]|nr:Preprotein translocase subunit SecG [Bacteriovoracaceae bacterium]